MSQLSKRRRGGIWLFVLVLVVAAVTVPLALEDARTKNVVLMGDSLMAEAAPAISTYLGFQGYRVDASAAVPGAGLLDTERNWVSVGRQLIAQDDPSVVVVEYVGNYATFGGIPGVSVYSGAFYRDWATISQRLEDVLTSRGAIVYWVIGPPVDLSGPEIGIQTLDRIYEHLRAPNSATGTPPLIDVTPAVTGGTGNYAEFLAGPGGQPVEVREPDGVHFTPFGASLLGRAIASAVRVGAWSAGGDGDAVRRDLVRA